MRKLLSFLLILCCLSPATAQQAPGTIKDEWSRLHALKNGITIYVHADARKAACALSSVDDQSLACLSHGTTFTFARAEIKSVAVRHLGRSTLIGFAIGAGGGAIAGAASGSKDGLFTRPELASAFAFVFGAVGAIIGAATGAFPKTIYNR